MSGQETIALFKGLYCTGSCDGRVDGIVKGKSIFVIISDQTYRLSLARILAGETEIRGSWIIEAAANLTPEQIERREEAARNWLD